MKVIDLLEASGTTKGSWKIQNLSGVVKTFKDDETSDARAWMRNRGDVKQIWDKSSGHWIVDPKKQDREDRKADREQKRYDREDRAAERGPKVDMKAIYDKVMNVIGNVFPDGDPIDQLFRPLQRMGVPEYSVGEYIDKAMKKHGHSVEKKGMYGYMAVMWDDLALDAMHDAKQGHEAREPFVRMENGKPVLQDNPWKVSEGDVIRAKFGKDKERADLIAKGTPMTMMQAFGSREMNILHDAGIKLTEKPSYWEDFEGNGFAAKDNIHQIKLKKAEKAMGEKFKVLKGSEVFGSDVKPKYPLTKMKSDTGALPNMFIIEFNDGSRYLVDVTQANTYIRMWQKIVTGLSEQSTDAPKWYIVRDKDDAIACGPYDSKRAAEADTRSKKWYIDSPNKYYIDFGRVDSGFDYDLFIPAGA